MNKTLVANRDKANSALDIRFALAVYRQMSLAIVAVGLTYGQVKADKNEREIGKEKQ